MQKTQEVEVQNLESLKQSKSEKDILLEEYDKEQNRAKNITFRNLLYVYIAIFLTLLVVLPKIYVSNQIYYTSKEINAMYHKYTALKEEKAYLQRQLESIRFKIEVIDEVD